MCDSMLEKFGLSRDAILKTSKETSSAKTATAAAAATVSRIHTESAVNPKPATADGGDASGADIDGLKTNADGDDRAANAAAAAAHKASISILDQSSLVDRLDFLDPHPHCLYKMGVVKVCYKTFFGPPLGAVGVSIYRECMLE